MKYVIGFAVLAVSWLVGVFGFSQIIGSLQNLKVRHPGMSAFTIIIWVVILAAVCFVVHRFFVGYRILYYIGTGISFLLVLSAGKIQ